MDSFWRQTVVDGAPRVLGFLCVGDSCVRSNSKYGRGCTWPTVGAHHGADLLAEVQPAGERVCRYEQLLEDEFRNDWLTMRKFDRGAEAAFEVASGRRPATFNERFNQWFQQLANDTTVIEPGLFHEVWTGYHRLTEMAEWIKQPHV